MCVLVPKRTIVSRELLICAPIRLQRGLVLGSKINMNGTNHGIVWATVLSSLRTKVHSLGVPGHAGPHRSFGVANSQRSTENRAKNMRKDAGVAVGHGRTSTSVECRIDPNCEHALDSPVRNRARRPILLKIKIRAHAFCMGRGSEGKKERPERDAHLTESARPRSAQPHRTWKSPIVTHKHPLEPTELNGCGRWDAHRSGFPVESTVPRWHDSGPTCSGALFFVAIVLMSSRSWTYQRGVALLTPR